VVEDVEYPELRTGAALGELNGSLAGFSAVGTAVAEATRRGLGPHGPGG
jgi:hypothetical protein